jgi:hypothetical protein
MMRDMGPGSAEPVTRNTYAITYNDQVTGSSPVTPPMPGYQVVADQRPLMVRLAARVADAGGWFQTCAVGLTRDDR